MESVPPPLSAELRASLPLFPLQHGLFPDGLMSLQIFEVRYLDMVKKAVANKTPFGIIGIEAGHEVNRPGESLRLRSIGCLAEIIEHDMLQPALYFIRVRGTDRFRLTEAEQGRYGLWLGQIEPLLPDPTVAIPDSLQPLANRLGRLIADLQRKRVPPAQMPILPPYRLDECGWVANRWAELMPLTPAEQQSLIACSDPLERLERLGKLAPGLFEAFDN
ncbi:MAG: LON peptidase substrate-binding domain-containing protein [Burkholderiaceae bacterium]